MHKNELRKLLDDYNHEALHAAGVLGKAPVDAVIEFGNNVKQITER